MKNSTKAAIFAMAAHLLFLAGAVLTFHLVQTMHEIGTPSGIMVVFAGIGALLAFTAIVVPVVICNNIAGE